MNTHTITTTLGAFVLSAGCIALPAMAQSQDDERAERRQQDRNDRAEQADRQDREDERRPGGDRTDAELDWEQTSIIGYDLDGDGFADIYYLATTYEVEQMRERAQGQERQMSSRDRQRMQEHRDRIGRGDTDSMRRAGRSRPGEGMRQGERMQRADRMQQGDRRDPRSTQGDRQGRRMMAGDRDERGAMQADRVREVSGRIRGIRSFQLTGVGEPRMIARVETDRGERVAVVLGPQGRFEDMDLETGMQVDLRVRRGSIDNRTVLIADSVGIDDRTIRIDQPRMEDLKRISGEIMVRRTRELRPRDGDAQEHLMLKIKDADGRVHVVSLGPASRRDEQRLREGEQVSVLAAPARVNGRQVFFARKISHDGQIKNLAQYRPEGRERDDDVRRTSSPRRRTNG